MKQVGSENTRGRETPRFDEDMMEVPGRGARM